MGSYPKAMCCLGIQAEWPDVLSILVWLMSKILGRKSDLSAPWVWIVWPKLTHAEVSAMPGGSLGGFDATDIVIINLI